MTSLLQNKRFLFIVFAVFLFNCFMLSDGALWDEDEAAYGGFAYTMAESGNWAIPEFPWSSIHRKTPLHFWEIALSFKIFGPTEFALRLPGILAIIGTVLAVFGLGRRIFGQQTALAAAIILGSTLFIPVLTKNALTDSSLLLWETVALLSLLNFLKTPHWLWNSLFWFSVSMGLLVKGPPILILVGGLWVFLFIFLPAKRAILIKTHPWLYGLIALLPLAAWLGICWQKDGGIFVTFLWDWYVVKRVGGSVLGQTGFPGYHLLVLVLSFLPWLTFFPSSLAALWRLVKQRDEVAIFLAGWLVFGWFFYEAMSSKLPTYSIAAQPAIAILIARQILATERNDYAFKSWDRGMAILYLFISLILTLTIIMGAYWLKSQLPTVGDIILKAIPVASLLWITAFIAVVGVYMDTEVRHSIYTIAMVSCGLGFTFLACLSVLPLIEKTPIKATRNVVWEARKMAGDNDTCVVFLPNVGMRQPSVAFYVYQLFGKKRAFYSAPEPAFNSFLSQVPKVLITDETNRNLLEARFKEQGRQFTLEQRVEWWDTDGNLAKVNFYIIRN